MWEAEETPPYRTLCPTFLFFRQTAGETCLVGIHGNGRGSVSLVGIDGRGKGGVSGFRRFITH